MKKRRLFSIVLSLCMVLALMPQMVFAENDDTSELQNLLDNGGTVTLEKDYTITSSLQVDNKTVTLDLNGHVIKKNSNGDVIKVIKGANLTLQDSSPKTVHTGEYVSLPAGGVITNNKSNTGSGVYVDGSSFTMTGGVISDCSSAGGGGGVCVQNNGSFTMTGGAIYDCSAEVSGGGVNVADSSFTMNGGAIYDCSAEASGGGVDVAASSFTMNGGAIYDCFAEYFGDAVSVNNYSTVNANGGTIKGTVYSYGLIQKTATDGGTKFYDKVTIVRTSISYGIYYGGIDSNDGTIAEPYHTVNFNLNGGSGSIPTQYFVGTDTAPALEPAVPTREGYEFAGWYTDEELTTLYDFDNTVTGDITLYAGWGLSVPFTTTVKQDGNVVPGETTFTLELVDNKGNVLSPEDIEVTASITTNGAGNYDGTLTIEGTSKDIANMLSDKVFVKQKGIDDSNWTVDPKVWYLIMEEKSSEDTNDDAIAELSVLDDPDALSGKYVAIYPAEYSETENGRQYEVISGEAAVEKMTFTNTYTKSVYVPSYPIGPVIPADPPGDIGTDEPGDEDNPGDIDNPGDTDNPGDIEEPGDTDEPAGDTEEVNDDSDKTSDASPKTGDSTDLAPWIALMILSGAGIGGMTLYTRRKRTNE